MKIARFMVDGEEYHGQVDGDQLRVIKGSIFGEFEVTKASYSLNRVKLLAPARPVNFWGVGENYPVHVDFRVAQSSEEMRERAKRFTPWHKGVGALIASGDTVVFPADLENLEYEGEIAIVIGTPAFHVSAQDAPHYIFGYSICNDISGADYHDFTMWRMKSCDTFGPVGPWIETEIDPHTADIITRVNGVEEGPRQH